MARRKIWLRLGVTVYGTEKQIERVVKGNGDTLKLLVLSGHFKTDGESYIPENSIEAYNCEYETNHEVNDVDFNL